MDNIGIFKAAYYMNNSIYLTDVCKELVSELDEDERKMFLEDLGLTESGLEKLVRASYHLLGLMSFLTAGEDEKSMDDQDRNQGTSGSR